MPRFFRDLIDYAIARRKWWLLPFVVLCILVGLIGFTISHPAVSPFLYSLF
jgi:hypothetical protein